MRGRDLGNARGCAALQQRCLESRCGGAWARVARPARAALGGSITSPYSAMYAPLPVVCTSNGTLFLEYLQAGMCKRDNDVHPGADPQDSLNASHCLHACNQRRRRSMMLVALEPMQTARTTWLTDEATVQEPSVLKLPCIQCSRSHNSALQVI